MTIYKHADGELSSVPTTYEKACEVNSRTYDDRNKCKTCKQVSIKYTKNQTCLRCALIRSANLFNLNTNISRLIWTDENGKHWGEAQGGLVLEIPEDEYQHMESMIDLAATDQDYHITTEPCRKHGHYGIKYLGKCYECHNKSKQPTPRQQALMNGDTWYTPDQACARCGEKALKNVHNGSCRGCIPARAEAPDDNVTNAIMRDNPDMVISKDDAEAFGFKVFRTGKTCKNGHTSWRYVSTGNCVECLKERRGE